MSYFDDNEDFLTGNARNHVREHKRRLNNEYFDSTEVEYVHKNLKWITKEGKKLHFHEMTLKHIYACISMLKKRDFKHDKLLIAVFRKELKERRL